jgi:RNA polymerase sigma-70 factor (ECF subfamily)
VARVQDGDPRAELRLVELYGRGIAVLLDRHTNGRPEAEDLFQETFRLVIEKLRRGELREPAKLPGFIAAIARSLAIEHYRKAARRKTEPDSDGLAAVAAATPGPLGSLLAHENAALVRRVIAELDNARDRQILLRFYIAEEDKERISADFGLSSLQFNRVLHRARQRYKELFLERAGEPGGPRGAGERRSAAAASALLLVVASAIFAALVPLLKEAARGLAR